MPSEDRQETMTTMLPFGRECIPVTLPIENVAAVAAPDGFPALEDPEREVFSSLSHPVGSPEISRIMGPGARVLIICDDNTRATPAEIMVGALLKELGDCGVPDRDVEILMALGTHRPMTEDEIFLKLGSDIVRRIRVTNHDFRDPTELVNLGLTRNGTPIVVNKAVLGADVAIGIGSIAPHHVCGYSGGAKIVQPGICGEETTAYTHLFSVRTRRSYLGIVENPVRHDMEEIAERARVGIIFNAVLNRDGQPVGFVFGDVKAAFRAGTSVAEKVYRIFVPEQTPIVIAGSHLCDIDFWQAHKALYPSDIVVEEGGTIIVVTPCPEGVAVTHPELELFASRSWRDIDSMTTSRQIRDGVAAALAMAWARIRERAQIIMVSDGFGPEKAAELGFLHARTVEEALDLAWMRHGSHARVTVLPYAPDTLPVILSPPPS